MPKGTLLYCPSFTALRSEALSRADSKAGSGPERVLFCEENSYQHEAIADAWAATYQPLRLTVTDISSIVSRLHERLFGPYPGVSAFERRRVIEQALVEVDDAGLLQDARNHTDVFSALFRELEAEGLLTPTAVRSRLEETGLSDTHAEPVAKAFESYVDIRSELVHQDAVPRNQKLLEVTAAERSLRDVIPTVDVIVVSGLLEPSLAQEGLLRRLADEFTVLYLLPQTSTGAASRSNRVIEETWTTLEGIGFESEYVAPEDEHSLLDAANAMFTPVMGDTHCDNVLSWHRAPTPDREARHVSRRIREDLAENGYAPDELLVMAPGLLTYREQIADAFNACEIGYAMNLGVFLEHTYAGRAVLDAVECCVQPTSELLAGLASNPVVDLPDIHETELTDVCRRLYTSDIGRYRAELRSSRDGVDAFLERTDAVRTADPDTIVSRFRSLLEWIGIGDPANIVLEGTGSEIAYEKRALTRVYQSLESVEIVCTTRSPPDSVQELTSALEGVRVPAPRQDASGLVEVIGLQDTPMADFSRLYVLGVTAEHLPGQDNHPRYFRRIGDALGLLPEYETRNRARYRFGTMLANAESVHITTPERTVDDEQVLVSPLVDELKRVTNLEPTTGIQAEKRGSCEDLQQAMGRSKADASMLIEAVEYACANQEFESKQGAITQQGVRCAGNRARRDLTRHDSQLDAETIESLRDDLTRAPFSYNRLTAYATCSFKYLLETGLGVDEPEPIEPEIDPREVGSLVHDVLERFFTSLQTTRGEPVDLAGFDRNELERRLLDASEEAVRDAEHERVSVFDERLLSILLAGLSSPEENDHYDAIGPRHGPDEGLLVRFLDEELGSDGTHYPALFEERFGDDGPLQSTDGTELNVGGIIDRIDVDPDTGRAVVYDYKTSHSRRIYALERHAAGGVDFQLPLYALAAESMLDSVESVVDAAYYMVRPDPDVNRFGWLSRRFDDGAYEEFLYEVTPRRIRRLLEALENGAFHPAVVGEETARCEYCSYSDICDVRHHRRHEVIDAAADQPNVYIPDSAWSDDWDDLHARLEATTGGELDD